MSKSIKNINKLTKLQVASKHLSKMKNNLAYDPYNDYFKEQVAKTEKILGV